MAIVWIVGIVIIAAAMEQQSGMKQFTLGRDEICIKKLDGVGVDYYISYRIVTKNCYMLCLCVQNTRLEAKQRLVEYQEVKVSHLSNFSNICHCRKLNI